MSANLPLGGSRTVPKGWKVYSLDQIKSPEPYSCDAGPFGSNISSKYFVEEGIPVIRGKNLTDDLTRFVPKEFAFVTEQRARQKYKAQHVRADDLVFTCWGTIGQVGLIPDNPLCQYRVRHSKLRNYCRILRAKEKQNVSEIPILDRLERKAKGAAAGPGGHNTGKAADLQRSIQTADTVRSRPLQRARCKNAA